MTIQTTTLDEAAASVVKERLYQDMQKGIYPTTFNEVRERYNALVAGENKIPVDAIHAKT